MTHVNPFLYNFPLFVVNLHLIYVITCFSKIDLPRFIPGCILIVITRMSFVVVYFFENSHLHCNYYSIRFRFKFFSKKNYFPKFKKGDDVIAVL